MVSKRELKYFQTASAPYGRAGVDDLVEELLRKRVLGTLPSTKAGKGLPRGMPSALAAQPGSEVADIYQDPSLLDRGKLESESRAGNPISAVVLSLLAHEDYGHGWIAPPTYVEPFLYPFVSAEPQFANFAEHPVARTAYTIISSHMNGGQRRTPSRTSAALPNLNPLAAKASQRYVRPQPSNHIQNLKFLADNGGDYASLFYGIACQNGLAGFSAQAGFDEAERQYRKVAQKGDPTSAFLLAELLSYRARQMAAKTPKRDSLTVEAASFYKRAAEKGHLRARSKIAGIIKEVCESLFQEGTLDPSVRVSSLLTNSSAILNIVEDRTFGDIIWMAHDHFEANWKLGGSFIDKIDQALLLARAGYPQNALTAYQEILATTPVDTLGRNYHVISSNIAAIYDSEGRHPEAYAMLQDIFEQGDYAGLGRLADYAIGAKAGVGPDIYLLHRVLAMAAANFGKIDEYGRSYFHRLQAEVKERLWEEKPDGLHRIADGVPIRNLRLVLAPNGHQARYDWLRFRAEVQPTTDIMLALGTSAYERKDFTAALNHYDRAEQHGVEVPDLVKGGCYEGMAKKMVEENRHAEAIRHYAQAANFGISTAHENAVTLCTQQYDAMMQARSFDAALTYAQALQSLGDVEGRRKLDAISLAVAQDAMTQAEAATASDQPNKAMGYLSKAVSHGSQAARDMAIALCLAQAEREPDATAYWYTNAIEFGSCQASLTVLRQWLDGSAAFPTDLASYLRLEDAADVALAHALYVDLDQSREELTDMQREELDALRERLAPRIWIEHNYSIVPCPPETDPRETARIVYLPNQLTATDPVFTQYDNAWISTELAILQARLHVNEKNYTEALARYDRAHQNGHPGAQDEAIKLCLKEAAATDHAPRKRWFYAEADRRDSLSARVVILEDVMNNRSRPPQHWYDRFDTKYVTAMLYVVGAELHDERLLLTTDEQNILDALMEPFATRAWERLPSGQIVRLKEPKILLPESLIFPSMSDPGKAFDELFKIANEQGLADADHPEALGDNLDEYNYDQAAFWYMHAHRMGSKTAMGKAVSKADAALRAAPTRAYMAEIIDKAVTEGVDIPVYVQIECALAMADEAIAHPARALGWLLKAAEHGAPAAKLRIVEWCHPGEIPYPSALTKRLATKDHDILTTALLNEIAGASPHLLDDEKARLAALSEALMARAWRRREEGGIVPVQPGESYLYSEFVFLPLGAEGARDFLLGMMGQENASTEQVEALAGLYVETGDPVSALNWYDLAVSMGSLKAHQAVVDLCLTQSASPGTDPHMALDYLQRLRAMDVDVSSESEIACLLAIAEGQAGDPPAAVEWLYHASELGSAEALLRIIEICQDGHTPYPAGLLEHYPYEDTEALTYFIATDLNSRREELAEKSRTRFDAVSASLALYAWQSEPSGTLSRIKGGVIADGNGLFFLPSDIAEAIEVLKEQCAEAPMSLDLAYIFSRQDTALFDDLRPPQSIIERFADTSITNAAAHVLSILESWHNEGTGLPDLWLEARGGNPCRLAHEIAVELHAHHEELPPDQQDRLGALCTSLLQQTWVVCADNCLRPAVGGIEGDQVIAPDQSLMFIDHSARGAVALLAQRYAEHASLDVAIAVIERREQLGLTPTDLFRQLTEILYPENVAPYRRELAEGCVRTGEIPNGHHERARLQPLWDQMAYELWQNRRRKNNKIRYDNVLEKTDNDDHIARFSEDEPNGNVLPFTCREGTHRMLMNQRIGLGVTRHQRLPKVA